MHSCGIRNSDHVYKSSTVFPIHSLYCVFPVKPLYCVQSNLCTEISLRLIPGYFVNFISNSYGVRLDFLLSSPPQPTTNILIFSGNRLDYFFCLCIICKSFWRTGHVARMWDRRGVYRVLVSKPEGNRPLGRPRLRWEDNIKMDLHEVGYAGRD